MIWKDTVTTMSEKVFPGLSWQIDHNFSGNDVMSNLPLQMALYFNIVLTPFWITVLLLHLNYNYIHFSEINKFILIAILFTVFLIELLRLYLGCKGNLEDKIPELAGFWILSILIQFPLQGFLLFNPYFRLYIVEIIVQSVMFIMLCIQLVASYSALKYTAAQQSNYFRVMKFKTDLRTDIERRYKIKAL